MTCPNCGHRMRVLYHAEYQTERTCPGCGYKHTKLHQIRRDDEKVSEMQPDDSSIFQEC
jgi:Zn ribbon nucleic-acid-binding protein